MNVLKSSRAARDIVVIGLGEDARERLWREYQEQRRAEASAEAGA